MNLYKDLINLRVPLDQITPLKTNPLKQGIYNHKKQFTYELMRTWCEHYLLQIWINLMPS